MFHTLLYGSMKFPAIYCAVLNTVTIRLNLPDSWLQFFVHSSVSVNPPQSIYGGTGAALISSRYKIIDHTLHICCGLTLNYGKLKRLRETLLGYPACFSLSPSRNTDLRS
jgi:hypothetical protein